MNRKEWQVSELKNLLAMIMLGFTLVDIAKAFKCNKGQIQRAVTKHFDSSVIYIRMKYKIRVMK